MLVSFLVPVYNVEKYLAACIESILCQTGADFEIILLDDGSTDNSGEICDRYAEEYPEIIRVIHKKNEGLLLTRRLGFCEARGEWFACVDSDDLISPVYLKTIAEALKKYPCDMLMFDYRSIYPDGHTEVSGIDITDLQMYSGEQKKEIYKKRLLTNKYCNMWSKVFKREIIDFDTDYGSFGIKNMCEDAIQVLELFTRAEMIVLLPEALYLYRRNIQSISTCLSADSWFAMRVSYELGWKYLADWHMSNEVEAAYAHCCATFFCDYSRWIVLNSGLSAERMTIIFDEEILKNRIFIIASERYKSESSDTAYRKISNPMILYLLKNRKLGILKKMLHAEMSARSLLNRK